MIDGLLWWTGALTWAYFSIHMLRAWWELGEGFARACSWIRWRWRLSKTHGVPFRWFAAPLTFLKAWLALSFVEDGDVKWAGPGGYWHGYGKWHVYPKADVGRARANAA